MYMQLGLGNYLAFSSLEDSTEGVKVYISELGQSMWTTLRSGRFTGGIRFYESGNRGREKEIAKRRN
jgi:hypothetical protein